MSFPLATIDSAALRNNLGVVRRLAPRSRVLAVIKANAYGHGIVPAARTLADADAFAVARLDEALSLRNAGVSHPVVLLEGVLSADQLAAAARHQLDLVVHCAEQIAILEQHQGADRFALWLKLDTGMNRLGFRLEEFAPALERLQRCRAAKSLRLMTHFASAEEQGGGTAQRQLARFHSLAGPCALERSIANSAGIVCLPEAHVEWVRPGIMLYGISPIPGQSSSALGLRPVMTLTAQLIAIRTVRAGESVGYGALWKAMRDSRVGIVAMGYGDGYPRGMRAGAPVLVAGREAHIVGRVSMDMSAIDLTDVPTSKLGDEVTLWGNGLPAERVAPFADTIGYELVCRIKERVTVKWV